MPPAPPQPTFTSSERGSSRSSDARKWLCARFQQYSVPDELGLALSIAAAALLTSGIASNFGTFGSVAGLLVVGIGLFVLQTQGDASVSRCFGLAVYPYLAQFVAHCLSGSAYVALVAFVVLIYLLVAAPNKFRAPM